MSAFDPKRTLERHSHARRKERYRSNRPRNARPRRPYSVSEGALRLIILRPGGWFE